MSRILGVAVALSFLLAAANVSAQQTQITNSISGVRSSSPGFVPRIFKTPLERRQLRSVPIINRPNRPGHIYGNTVRRLYYGRSSGFGIFRRR